MADHYMTPAAAQQQGVDLRQKEIDNFRKNAALDALTKTMGPEAGDPEIWGAAEKAQAAATEQPYVGPTAQADLQTKQLANAEQQRKTQAQNLFTLGTLLKKGGDPALLDNPVVQKYGGLQPQDAAQVKSFITGPDGKVNPDRVDALLSAGIGPAGSLAAGGTAYGVDPNTGTTYQLGRTKAGEPTAAPLPNGIVPTAVTNSQTQQFNGHTRAAQGWARIGVQQQNANTSTYRAGVQGNNSQYGAPDGTALPQQGGPTGVVLPDGRPFDSNLAGQFVTGAIPGATITSEQRSTGHNAAVGGVVNSHHLNGTAVDFTLPKGTSFEDAAQVLASSGVPTRELINEGDHVHWAWGPKPGASGGPQPQAPATSGTPQLSGKPLATRTGAAQQIVTGQVNLDNANAIAGSMLKQISPYTTGAGSLMSSIPGGLANDLRRNAQTLKAQAAQAVLQGSKNAQGSTGLGRILQAEYQNFTNMYGNMEQDQSTKQFAYHLGLLKQSLNKMTNIQRAGFQAQWKTDPESALGMPKRSSGGSGALPGGFTYVGARKG